MNLVYVSDQYWPTLSGVSVSIDSFRRELSNLGHNTYLLAPDYPGADDYDRKANDKTVFRFRSHKPIFNDENRLVYKSEKKRVCQLLNAIKPDLIHVHTEFSLGQIASSFAVRYGIPLVMTAHTNYEELVNHYIPFVPSKVARYYCRAKMRRVYNKANTVIVPTSLMELLLSLYFVSKPIVVIPTGIDKADFHNTNNSAASICKTYPRLKDKRILFFAGRLGREKNITFLMDVLQRLLPDHADLMLVISGSGPAKQELQDYAEGKGVAANVVFTGFIERQRLKDFYSLADIFVFASKVESQGLVVLEAMTCGIPVVAIGKMGTREVMGGDSGGFMVDDDLEMFAEKVGLLLSDRSVYRSKSLEALRHAQNWRIHVQVARMHKLYQSLVMKFRNKRCGRTL